MKKGELIFLVRPEEDTLPRPTPGQKPFGKSNGGCARTTSAA